MSSPVNWNNIKNKTFSTFQVFQVRNDEVKPKIEIVTFADVVVIGVTESLTIVELVS